MSPSKHYPQLSLLYETAREFGGSLCSSLDWYQKMMEVLFLSSVVCRTRMVRAQLVYPNSVFLLHLEERLL